MPRLWIFSDLHQDWADNAWDPTTHAPACDVIVVAGDAHSPLTKAIDWLADRLAGAQILYVPGNHDFWWDGGDDRYTLTDQLARGRDLAARRGVTLLDNDSVTLGGVRFLGATLWTDLRLGTWSATDAARSARRSMNDYRQSGAARRASTNTSGRPTPRPSSLQPRLAGRSAWAAARWADRGCDTPRAAPVFPAGWL